MPVRAFYPCLQLLSVEAFFYHTPVLSWQMLSVRKLCRLIRKLPCRGVWEIEDAGRRPCQHPPVSARALLGHRGWCPLKVQSISTQMVAGAECGGVCICHQAHRSSWGQVEGECLQGLRFTSQVNFALSLQSLQQVLQLNTQVQVWKN